MRRLLASVLLAAACSTPVAPLPSLPQGFPAPAPTPRARPVTIEVLGPSGPVADVRVCAVRPTGRETCATSGAEGRAVVEIVPGTYAIRATPAVGRRLKEGVVTVELTEDDRAVVAIEGLATIAGTVRDPEGKTVRDAEVCAHSTTAEDLECARTRADGTYVVETRPGIHKVEFIGPPDGSRLLTQWAGGRLGSYETAAIDVRTKDATGVDATLDRGVVLSGRVTAARTGEIQKEAQVCTYTLSAPLGWECDLTDRFGRYSLLRAPDRYWVWVIPSGERGTRLIPQRYDRVLVGVDATPFDLTRDRTLDVALTEGLLLHGRVTTTDGAPVVLALACADTPFPTGRICRGTGDDGSYEIAVRPETYIVNVYPPADSDVVGGYWPDARPDWVAADEVRVGPGDRRLDVVLPRGVRLYGTVRDPRGVPVEGATINVNAGGVPRWFGSTDLHGRYAIAVPRGTYTVDVFSPRAVEVLSVMGQLLVIEDEIGYDVVLPDIPP